MALTVRDLLERPRLQLTLVSGADGVAKEISWAHASDLPDPWNWLGPGELLLTNGTGIGADAADQVRFLEQLSQIGASGLVIGLGTGGQPVTGALAERAADLAMPLLTVPYSVRFADIVRAVAESDDREHSAFLGDVANFYDVLRLSLAAGDLGPATFDALGRRLGMRLYLADAETGASVFDDAPIPLAESLVRAVAEHGHAIPGLLRLSRQPGQAPVSALAVAVPGEPMTALVVEPLGPRLPSAMILQHVAIAGAMQLAQIVSLRQRQRRSGGELLERLLSPAHAGHVSGAELKESGIDLGGCVLAVLRPGRPGTEDDLHLACSRAHLPDLLLRRDDLLFAVIPRAAAVSSLP
ncbi:MAG: PucR family transcriptional regulator ligand-binding domain-containing protein, partial [Streptosporangiaceae bacterium]